MSSNTIKINDRWLRAALKEELGSDKFTIEKLQQITSLAWEEYRAEAGETFGAIQSLSGLEHCSCLQELNLDGNDVKSLEPLKELTELESIWLVDCDIKDLSPLANKEKLHTLTLDGNRKLKNIEPLCGLPALGKLGLRTTAVKDLSPLLDLPVLEEVNIFDIKNLKLGKRTKNMKAITALEKRGVTVLRPREVPPPPKIERPEPIPGGKIVGPAKVAEPTCEISGKFIYKNEEVVKKACLNLQQWFTEHPYLKWIPEQDYTYTDTTISTHLKRSLNDHLDHWRTGLSFLQAIGVFAQSGSMEITLPHLNDKRIVVAGGWEHSIFPPLPKSCKRLGSLQFRNFGNICSIDFSPNGRWVASAGKKPTTFSGLERDILDGTLTIWDCETGKQTHQFTCREIEEYNKVCFSPDGTKLATVSEDWIIDEIVVSKRVTTVRVIDIQTGCIIKLFRNVFDVYFSPDGKYLVTNWGENRCISIWNISSWEKLYTLEKFEMAGFMPDGQSFLTYRGNNVYFCNTATGDIIRTLEFNDWVRSAKLQLKQNRIWIKLGNLSADWQCIDLQTGEPISLSLNLHKYHSQIFFEETFILENSGSSIQKIDVPGEVLLDKEYDFSWMGRAALSPDKSTLAVPTNDTISFIDINTGEPRIDSYAKSGVGSLVTCGNLLAAKNKVWDLKTGEIQATYSLNAGKITFAPDQSFIAGLDMKEVRLCSLVNGEKQNFDIPGYGSYLRVSPDSKILLCGYMDGVSIINLTSGEQENIELSGNPWQFLFVDENLVIVIWPSSNAFLDLKDKKVTSTGIRSISQTCVIVDNVLLSINRQKDEIEKSDIVNLDHYEITCRLPEDNFKKEAFSPDGKFIVGCFDKYIRLYDLTSGKICFTHCAHHKEILTVAFSDDSKKLITGSQDTTMVIWDLEKML